MKSAKNENWDINKFVAFSPEEFMKKIHENDYLIILGDPVEQFIRWKEDKRRWRSTMEIALDKVMEEARNKRIELLWKIKRNQTVKM